MYRYYKINDGCFMLPIHKKCFDILSLNFFTIKLTIGYIIERKDYLFKTLINPCVIYLRSISYLLRNMSGFRPPQCSRYMLFLVWCPNRTFFLRTAIVHYRSEVQCYHLLRFMQNCLVCMTNDFVKKLSMI